MNYAEHILISTGSLCTFVLAADITGLTPAPAPITLATSLGMAALGAIIVDIDHPAAFISSTAPKRLFKVGIRLLGFLSIPAFITIASSRRVYLIEPGDLLLADLFRLSLVVTIGASGLYGLSRLVHLLFVHRGPIHSPAFLLGATAVLTLLLAIFITKWWWLGIIFGWGWLTHLTADSLTARGVPFLWPFTRQRFKLLPGCLLTPVRIITVVISLLSIVLLFFRLTGIF